MDFLISDLRITWCAGHFLMFIVGCKVAHNYTHRYAYLYLDIFFRFIYTYYITHNVNIHAHIPSGPFLAILTKKKKAFSCQNIDRTHWSNGIVERSKSKCKFSMQQSEAALWSNGIQASSEWQYSSPMMLGDPVGAAVIFQGVPLLITTLFKCSGRQYVRSLAPLQLVAL